MRNSTKVTTRTIQWLQVVRDVDPKTSKEEPPVAYVFGRGRVFYDTGKGLTPK